MEKNKLMMIIIIVLLVLLLGALAGVTYVVLNALPNITGTSEPTPVTNNDSELSLANIKTLRIDNAFQVNLRDENDGKKHAINIKVAFSYKNTDTEAGDALAAMMTDNQVVIEDRINSILRKFTYSELDAEGGMDTLKQVIFDVVQELTGSDLLIEVLLTEPYLI